MATNNCVYETFFDSRSTNDRCPYFNQVDFLINHPVLQKINVSRSVDHFQRCLPQCADDDKSWLQSPVNSTCSSVSSLRTVCSLEESQQQQQQQVHDIGRVPRLRHSASVHHQVQRPSKFSLNLSPKLRSKFCEILSPISDKSQEIGENESSTVLIKSVPVERTTRPKSLFSHVTESSTGGFNSSDSGISISAHSLLSHDALQFKQTHVSLDNAQEMLDREDEKEESLPFIMPKLHRGKMPSNRPGRSLVGLSLSLPFPSKNPINTVPLSAILSDIVDEGISLHSQTWYHGSISRYDAQMLLEPTPEGTFLVRDSQANNYDYFLAARGDNSFLHVQISCQSEPGAEHYFQLATLPNKTFTTVNAIVNHCAKIGIYSPHKPPVILKYPLADTLI